MEPFITAFKTALGRYADFSGRTSLGGYWRFWAVWFGIYLVLFILGSLITSLFTILAFLFALATLLPGIAAAVRRLHDTGKSGFFVLLGLIPFGGLVVLFFLVQASDGPNQYGSAAQD